jgi:hypothetical protein
MLGSIASEASDWATGKPALVLVGEVVRLASPSTRLAQDGQRRVLVS